MDQFTKKQKLIDFEKCRAIDQYPITWLRIIEEWKAKDKKDKVWLTYSANYLFRTNDVRWAIDPFTLNARIPSAKKMDVAKDLASLTFVILTHAHSDHLDLKTIQELSKLPIIWIVPYPLLRLVKEAGLDSKFIRVPQVMEPIEIRGIRITPFNGAHYHKGNNNETLGISAMAYLVECGIKRWLFPGDTRNFKSNKFPLLSPVDNVFAHLWLGRGSALLKDPPLLNDFCQFYYDFKPNEIFKNH